MTREQALATLSRLVGPRLQEKTKQEAIVPFAEEHFYIAETDSPIHIYPHQAVILEYIFNQNHVFQQGGTAIYSCPKKSGKTGIAAVMGRWIAETWGRANEVYCLQRQTPVQTEHGSMKINDIVAKRYDGRVWSLNLKTDKLELQKIVGWHKTALAGRSWVSISWDDAKTAPATDEPTALWATEDHPILTSRGYVKAGELKTGDLLVTADRQPNHAQMKLVTGMLLGDGSLQHCGKKSTKYALRMSQGTAQYEWARIKATALADLETHPLKFDGRHEWYWLSKQSSFFGQLHATWYDAQGTKIVPLDLVKKYWSPALLAAWYLDDGCYLKGNKTLEISTHCFTKEEVDGLCALLSEAFGHCAVAPVSFTSGYGKKRDPEVDPRYHPTHFKIRINTVPGRKFCRYIARFVPPTMRYKLMPLDDLDEYDPSAWELGESTPFFKKAIITRGEEPKNPNMTYCIDVENNHNFVTVDGVIVHNCMANDYEQARGRIYSQILQSIELDPNYIKQRQTSSLGWKIIERQALFEPNGSTVKSLSGDYRGEAGSNPTATLWSELWGFQSEASRRLWEELTPVPTRKRAIRIVETYAGYEDSSDLLLDLYTLGLQGRRLTHDDLDWPFPDQPPIWVNERANLFMYWDSGPVAHRMPWQTDQYYQGQAAIMRDEAYRRLHLNEWVSSANAFIPEEWWTRLRHPLPVLDANTPVVLGVDASVSGDCTAITGVTRDPRNPRDVLLRFYDVWHPTPGSPINLALVDARLRYYFSQYNIVEVAYDQYQLHKLMMDIRQDGLAWVKPFSQNTLREVADKQLFDLIRDRRLGHNTGNDFDAQVKNAAAKQNVGDVDKLRIIKRGKDNHIDLVVALAMAAYECLRLNL